MRHGTRPVRRCVPSFRGPRRVGRRATVRRATVAATLSLVGLASSIGAQASGAVGPLPRDRFQRTALAEYEGVYAYHGGTSLVIVATDTILFAVIDEAKYPLRPLGGDRFVNAGGETIPFRRGTDGVVSGFVERSVFFARRTPVIDAAMAEAVRAVPRPVGTDGRPAPYVYAIPADIADGLRVGDVTEAGFDTASVARLVNRVLDGTYPDVHGILVYRGGRLVVEEYFYGYDRERPHQMRSASKSIVSALVGIAIDRGALDGDADGWELQCAIAGERDHGEGAASGPSGPDRTLEKMMSAAGSRGDWWAAERPGGQPMVGSPNAVCSQAGAPLNVALKLTSESRWRAARASI